MSSSRKSVNSSSLISTSLPPYCGSSTLSSGLTPIGSSAPSLSRRPGPTLTTTPSFSFDCEASGSRIPPIDLVGGSMRLICAANAARGVRAKEGWDGARVQVATKQRLNERDGGAAHQHAIEERDEPSCRLR